MQLGDGTILTWVVTAALWIYWIAVLLVLIGSDREPSTTLAWILVLWALPGFGLILYIFAGRDWAAITRKREWHREYMPIQMKFLEAYHENFADFSRATRARFSGTAAERVITTIETVNAAPPVPAREFSIHPEGDKYFDLLIEDISKAQRFVHMQYFIWERDELTTRICDALMDRVKAGVEVRIQNDYLGNIQYKKDQLEALKAAGAKIEYDQTQLGKLNYRNHRKITVIDGEIGHSGGFNIGQEYIDGGKRYPTWRDTGIRFTGPAVGELQKLFAARWNEVAHESLLDAKYFPDPSLEHGNTPVQVVAHGVEDHWRSSTRAYEVAIAGASDKVLIQSPYFVPDAGMMDVLINAALSGVEVHFMMTGWPDKKIAYRAAMSYWGPLMHAGGHVYLYTEGFFHAKSLVLDDQACAIGTMNMDIRSLRLHKELMVWCYDPQVVKRAQEIYAADLEKCREVTIAEIESYSAGIRFVNSAARLASNVI